MEEPAAGLDCFDTNSEISLYRMNVTLLEYDSVTRFGRIASSAQAPEGSPKSANRWRVYNGG